MARNRQRSKQRQAERRDARVAAREAIEEDVGAPPQNVGRRRTLRRGPGERHGRNAQLAKVGRGAANLHLGHARHHLRRPDRHQQSVRAGGAFVEHVRTAHMRAANR